MLRLRSLRELPLQDWLITTYLAVLVIALCPQAPSPARSESMKIYLILLTIYLSVVVFIRAQILTHPIIAPAIYRITSILCPALSYIFFRDYLPLINENRYDTLLYSIDKGLFGFEPAVWMQNWVTPERTEWFSFFYLSYFPLVYIYALPIVLFVRSSAQITEFTLGVLIVVCFGNLSYLLVPGTGPFQAMSELFHQPLPPGFFWNITLNLVKTNGAQLDIFPSLHTALTLVIVLYSWRFRRHGPHRFWWVTAFFFINIVIATLLLRWHYFIDIVAGIALAVVAHFAAAKLSTWESKYRQLNGLTPVYPDWAKPSRQAA